MPADFPARVDFCRFFVERSAEYFFASAVLFTDEARFGRDDIIVFTTNTSGRKRIFTV
jgi:hypothetical protein